MTRPDLLALSEDSLAALANRGLLKRAAREVADSLGPAVAEEGDQTVRASFADGTLVVLPPGATLAQASCSCPAAGVCRHILAAVLAYQGQPAAAPAAAPPSVVWSPGAFTDAQLEALLGKRAMAVARKARRAGYQAEVRRGSGAEPVPSVTLSSCTVRFLVPGELGYARADARSGAREDAIALAVWAFQAADLVDPAGATLHLSVGGPGPAAGSGIGESGVEPALAVVADLLAEGAVHRGLEEAPALAQARRALDQRNLRWPVDALDELTDQLDAYRSRSARYHPEKLAGLLAELVARHRCALGPAASPRPGVLGTEEPAQTPLRLQRLTGLGAHVRSDGDARVVEVYLAQGDSGLVLALRRRVEAGEGEEEPPAGSALGARRSAGHKLSALAAGNVVTESAVRSANRVVRIAESRVARTTVTPSTGAWDSLPPGILVTDLAAEAASWAGRAPSVVRPRVVAEGVRVVAVSSVEGVAWSPGSQQVRARIRDAVGGEAGVVLEHTSAAPGAVDALATWLAGEAGPVRFLAGHLRRLSGELVLVPTAVAAGDAVLVPAFARAGRVGMRAGGGVEVDPLAAVVGEALSVSAEVAHRGFRHLPAGWAGRASRAGDQLVRCGLVAAGAAVGGLGAMGWGAAEPEEALGAWADVHLRLLVTAEQL